jgi:mRNA-degrading endonuclease RelE of RelBE toxin-antitoxin system
MSYQWDFVQLTHPGGYVLECSLDGDVVGAISFDYDKQSGRLTPWRASQSIYAPPDFEALAWSVVHDRVPGAILDPSLARSTGGRKSGRDDRGHPESSGAGVAEALLRRRASRHPALAARRRRRRHAAGFDVELTRRAAKSLARLGGERKRIEREIAELETTGVVDHPRSVPLRGPMKGYWEIKVGHGATAMRIIVDFSGTKITVFDILHRGNTGWSER